MITLIIPCYNEEESIPLFYQETSHVLTGMDCDHEFLFINDGSSDKTLDILKELAETDETVKYLSFSRNFGKEAAMYAGFCNASGDYIAVMDADLQDPPSLLPKMLEILSSGTYDSVATRRLNRTGEPPVRSFFARKFYQIINRISDADIVDGARDFRLMTREMLEAILSMDEYNRFSKGIFGWVGFRTYWLPFQNVERVAGQTKWSFWKLFKYAIDGIINFSQAPLSIAAWGGCCHDDTIYAIHVVYHCTAASIRRPRCRVGFYNLCHRLHWWIPTVLSRYYWAVYLENLHGNKKQTPFHHFRY